MTRKFAISRVVEGGALGVAIWCILFSVQLLPGLAADTWGVLLFAIAGMVASLSPLRPVLAALFVLGAAIIVVVTQTSLSNLVAERWVREDPPPSAPLAAVIVLSASANPNNTMSGGALDNLIMGLELARGGKITVLVTTTVEERFPGGLISTQADQGRIVGLLGGGVKWLRTAPTTSTRDEALQASHLLLPQGMLRVGVVTAPMHTRRACAAFERVGFTVTCIPALVRAAGGRDPGPWPADRLRVFGDWVYERLATVKYRNAGWLK